jgi:hypothetical protein
MKKLFFVIALFAFLGSANANTISVLSNNTLVNVLGNDDKEKKKSCKKSDSCCKKAENKEKSCKKDGEGKACKKDEKKSQ